MPTVPPIGVNDLTTTGPEWSVGGVGGVQDGTQATQGANGFGGALENSIQSLDGLQAKAADASQALATGQATDPSSVVMTIERARLAM
jgi:flagellar hook-basal body complex protein FliE